MARKKKKDHRTITDNRRARYDYAIVETIEGGLCLYGSEVKALREGRASLQDSHAVPKQGEIFLINSYIGPYSQTRRKDGHQEKRPRKILLSRREINRFSGAVREKSLSLIPLSLYFNVRGIAKLELALAKGRRKYDKRELLKERDWKRQRVNLIER